MYNLHLTPEQLEFRDTVRGFVNDDLGDRALKLAASIRPPVLSGLLVPRDNHVTTGTSDQVANECCFQINRFHAFPLCGQRTLPQMVRPRYPKKELRPL